MGLTRHRSSKVGLAARGGGLGGCGRAGSQGLVVQGHLLCWGTGVHRVCWASRAWNRGGRKPFRMYCQAW